METGTTDKHQLRKEMKLLRDACPLKERSVGSKEIVNHLLTGSWYEQASDILVYSAIRSEVDLTDFCNQAWKDGKTLYFPRVSQDTMDFYRVDDWEQLEAGCFGVKEPRMKACPQLNPENERMPVLVPGVAFSKKGQRIGYGKGFYDKYLHAHPSLFPIGVCYELQVVEAIEEDSYDYRMEQIVTEQTIYQL